MHRVVEQQTHPHELLSVDERHSVHQHRLQADLDVEAEDRQRPDGQLLAEVVGALRRNKMEEMS